MRTQHAICFCKYCREPLTDYDLRMGPGDGECAKCGWDTAPRESVGERLTRQLAQSGRLTQRVATTDRGRAIRG